MRTALGCTLLLAALAGCGGVEFRRGLPALAKPQDGALIAGTAGWADLKRGKQAHVAGRLEAAVLDFEPLARRGYADAMLSLAATRSLQNGADAQASAIRWYRQALKARPDALVPLARVMTRSGEQPLVSEAAGLLNARLRQRPDPRAQAALLDLYSVYPALDQKRIAPALAATAAASPVIELRLAAIGWSRDAVVDIASAERLIRLCRVNLDIAPDCHVDLASYHRYRGDRASLRLAVDEALRAFERFTPLYEIDSLDRVPVDIAQIAGRYAAALVEQRDDAGSLEPLEAARDEAESASLSATLLLHAGGDDAIDGRSREDDAPQLLRIASAGLSLPLRETADATPAPPLAAAVNSQAEPELANQVLRWMLLRGPTMKVEAAGVAVAHSYLLPDVDLATVLAAGVADGNPRASLLLGELYFFDQRQPREARLAELNLKQALNARSTRLPAHYRLGRLYQQGYLGSPDPARSLDNFLTAARGRISAADQHLARLFYNSPGTRVNRVNAWVFARLAVDSGYPVTVQILRGGVPEQHDLLQRLSSDLTAAELTRAQALYQQERRVHMVSKRVPGQLVWIQGAAR